MPRAALSKGTLSLRTLLSPHSASCISFIETVLTFYDSYESPSPKIRYAFALISHRCLYLADRNFTHPCHESQYTYSRRSRIPRLGQAQKPLAVEQPVGLQEATAFPISISFSVFFVSLLIRPRCLGSVDHLLGYLKGDG